jgi:hypothetical protein
MIRLTILHGLYNIIIMILNNMEYPNRFLNHQLRPSFLHKLSQLKVKIIIIIKDRFNYLKIIILED